MQMYFKDFTLNILFNQYFFNNFGMCQYQDALFFKTLFKVESRIECKFFAKTTGKFQTKLLHVCQGDFYSSVEHAIPADFENMRTGYPQIPNITHW